jgi:hypothetical protein
MRLPLPFLAVFCVLVVVAGLGVSACGSACAPTGSGEAILPDVMPADFAFLACYGVGAKNQIDTFRGTFTKDIVSNSNPNPTVEFRLTADELDRLYGDLVRMHILEYPSQFPAAEDRDPKDGLMVVVTPYESYVLRIRAAGTEKLISWDDDENLQTPRAIALRAWFLELQTIIQNKPEYKAMPPAEAAYQ